eukprot:TRINITY_DN3514_c0_g1_i1.p1 TRINITY_DN3514_c0_g1~~TRINITY_DN3514_c0_g1_i1.p1  ORF type:complete len:102 (+),score=7.07 TRINITY_DN3514_c0_g1_i1:155-460(+)
MADRRTPALATILRDARSAGWQSGSAGALAMSCQIATLMWLHTAMTYEYKFGGEGLLKTLKYLRNSGGYRSLYGIGPALVQGTLGALRGYSSEYVQSLSVP